MALVRAALAAGAIALALAPSAFASTSVRGVTIRDRYVLGHRVVSCTWSEKTAHVQGYVRWSLRATHLVRQWAGTDRAAVCAMNGTTYTRTLVPAGPVRSSGVWIRRRWRDEPVAGFLGRRIIFGYRASVRLGARNLMAGKEWLVQQGRPTLTKAQAPNTTRAQFMCGARGTDGWYGCNRSALVRFRNGRVGLVEIGLASVPQAARILIRMGAWNAIAGDSGGGAEFWYKGHNFGTIPNGGRYSAWHRRLPDAIIVRRLP